MSFPVGLTRQDMEAFDTLDLLPLRQTVRVTHATGTRLGNQSLLDRISRPDRFRVLRHGTGAQILARNGLALAQAQLVLRQTYGALIDFGTPTAHRRIDQVDGTVLVPMMFLRVDAPRALRKDVLQILAERSTAPRDIAVQRHRAIVRMEAPLACLIGVEQQLLESTDGAAHILCWLARYEHGPGTDTQGVLP